MNENGKKRREWVKTAAIVFLTVMLLLTFFSQTIMNYSLPEVATQYVQSGTITAKIRGSGTVESGNPYEVKVTETRKVSEVAVRAGDTVQKGDILVYLEDVESDELKAALDALEKAQSDYEKSLLNAEVTPSDIQDAEAGLSVEDYRSQITARQDAVTNAKNAITGAENDVKAAQSEVDRIQQWHDAFDVQIAIEQNVDVTEETKIRDEAEGELKRVQGDRTATEQELAGLKDALPGIEEDYQRRIDSAKQEFGEDSDQVRELQASLDAERNRVVECENRLAYVNDEVARKEQILKDAQAKLDAKQNEDKTNTINNLKRQQSLVAADLAEAKRNLTQRQTTLTERQDALKDRQEELDQLIARIGRVDGLQSAQDAIDKAQKEVDRLREKTTGTTITAPISGTITSLNVTAGNNTSATTPVAVMQPEGKGYTLSFSVTNEQARRLSVGDQAELVNAWRYDDVVVTLSSIKPDTTDPSKKKMLTFDVSGSSVVAGQSLNLSVGQKSANYDLIVPNSAIREDNNGKFILIVESKSSPLGTRYTASRVDVEVLASDDTQSAISGALYGYEFVITTSTKPVEAGKLVRLAD